MYTYSVYKPTKEKNKKSEESSAYGVYSMQQLLDSFSSDLPATSLYVSSNSLTCLIYMLSCK